MQLDNAECWSRLRAAWHGVLGTVHAERGVDLVPVVFAIVDDQLVVPIDTVKPKSTTRLQRAANLEADPRCSLLVDHYDDDWSQLWWVRVHGRATAIDAPSEGQLAALASRYSQYAKPRTVVRALLLQPDAITGWAAS